MKYIQALVFLLISSASYAQFKPKEPEDFLHELRITSENDAYVFTFHDGYYTNGLFIQYSRAAKKTRSPKTLKRISHYQAGQMIFNSEFWRDDQINEIDRPFSGYLFSGAGRSWFYSNGNILMASIEAGASGKASLAGEVQRFYHKAFGLPKVRGWGFELNGEWALNGGIKFYQHLLKKASINHVDIYATGSIKLGNTFTNAAAGGLLRAGLFESPENSSFFSARTGKGTAGKLKRRKELFFFFHPQVICQAYNATIQGPMFNDIKGPVVSEPTRWVYMHHWGLHYSFGRISAAAQFTRKQKEAASMRLSKEKYGSIMFAYYFGKAK